MCGVETQITVTEQATYGVPLPVDQFPERVITKRRLPRIVLTLSKAELTTNSTLEKDARAMYFVGGDNCFSHPLGDKASRRYALASLMENGHVRGVDLDASP